MQIIPLQAAPSQQVAALLGAQACSIKVYQKAFGLFLDLYVDSGLIIGGVLCENLNKIVRSAYLGFDGDLTFIDNEGSDDPVYTGLGSRFSLAYLSPDEIAGEG